MKKIAVLLLITSLFTTHLNAKELAPWQAILQKGITQKTLLPTVIAWPCTYIPASQTGNGYAALNVRIFLDQQTGNYWSIAKVKIYCYFYHPRFPSGYYAWDYKTWTGEVPPNSDFGETTWMLSGGETFNTYWDYGAQAIREGDTELMSFNQE